MAQKIHWRESHFFILSVYVGKGNECRGIPCAVRGMDQANTEEGGGGDESD